MVKAFNFMLVLWFMFTFKIIVRVKGNESWIVESSIEDLLVKSEITETIKSHEKVVVCEIGDLAVPQEDEPFYDFQNSSIFDGTLCTHIMYTDYYIDDKTYDIQIDINSRDFEKPIDFLRTNYPNLKIILSVYCTDDRTPTFEAVISSKDNRHTFIENAKKFLLKFGFDGLDVNINSFLSNGRDRFTLFAKELKDIFQNEKLLISTSVSLLGERFEERVDISQVTRIFDLVFVDDFASAYYDEYTPTAEHRAPIYSSPQTKHSIHDDLKYLLTTKRANPNSLVLVMPFFGYSRRFQNPWTIKSGGVDVIGNARLERLKQNELRYRSICADVLVHKWKMYWDDKSKVPFLMNSTHWMTLESPRSIMEKTRYANQLGLRGVALWSIDADDFDAQCSQIKNPLLKSINYALSRFKMEEGDLLCSIFNKTAGNGNKSEKQISENWSPIVYADTHNKTIKKNSTVQIICAAEGTPLSNIYWMKKIDLKTKEIVNTKFSKDVTISFNATNMTKLNCGPYETIFSILTLKIRDITPQEYICVANNTFGLVSTSIYLSGNLRDIQTTIQTRKQWIIYGLCIAVLVLLLCNVGGYYYFVRKNCKGLTESEIVDFLKGKKDCLFDISKASPQEICGAGVYDASFEIPEKNYSIDFTNVLGSGNFGIVCVGQIEGTKVAVKSTKNASEKQYILQLLAELKILIFMGKHSHIVNLLGASTKRLRKGILYIFLEYCPHGSLETYLRKSTVVDASNNYENSEYTKMSKNKEITMLSLYKWSYQVANALEFLSTKKIVHGDLACRNVLVFNEDLVKVTDFGLSRKLYEYGNYAKKSQEPLPWRWMAIESLRHLTFSTQSDVWSLGMTIWEIFSLGEVPFPGISWTTDFVEGLSNNLRVHKPKLTTDKMYNLMLTCWNENPEERPNPSKIAKHLLESLQNHASKNHIVLTLESPYTQSILYSNETKINADYSNANVYMNSPHE